MKQQKSVFISYLILMISSFSLLCVFHLNATEHHRISEVLKQISLHHQILNDALSDRIQEKCSNSASETLHRSGRTQQDSAVNESRIVQEAYLKNQGSDCQNLKDMDDLIDETRRAEQKDIKEVEHNLRVLNYLNPFYHAGFR